MYKLGLRDIELLHEFKETAKCYKIVDRFGDSKLLKKKYIDPASFLVIDYGKEEDMIKNVSDKLTDLVKEGVRELREKVFNDMSQIISFLIDKRGREYSFVINGIDRATSRRHSVYHGICNQIASNSQGILIDFYGLTAHSFNDLELLCKDIIDKFISETFDSNKSLVKISGNYSDMYINRDLIAEHMPREMNIGKQYLLDLGVNAYRNTYVEVADNYHISSYSSFSETDLYNLKFSVESVKKISPDTEIAVESFDDEPTNLIGLFAFSGHLVCLHVDDNGCPIVEDRMPCSYSAIDDIFKLTTDITALRNKKSFHFKSGGLTMILLEGTIMDMFTISESGRIMIDGRDILARYLSSYRDPVSSKRALIIQELKKYLGPKKFNIWSLGNELSN